LDNTDFLRYLSVLTDLADTIYMTVEGSTSDNLPKIDTTSSNKVFVSFLVPELTNNTYRQNESALQVLVNIHKLHKIELHESFVHKAPNDNYNKFKFITVNPSSNISHLIQLFKKALLIYKLKGMDD